MTVTIERQDPLLFQVPFRAILAAPSQAGKTVWAVDQYLLHPGVLHKRVLVFCHHASIKSGPMQKLKQDFKGTVIFYQGLPQTKGESEAIHSVLAEGRDKNLYDCVLVDDLMNEAEKGMAKTFLADLFTSSRHYNASILSLQQMIHAGGSRKHRLSASYILLWDFPADASSANALFRQIAPTLWKRVQQAYDQVTSRKYTPFIITLVPGAGLLKYRSAWNKALDLARVGQVEV